MVTTCNIYRNWDVDFGRQGVSKNPCSDVYPGKAPFTEKNTQAMSNWLASHARYATDLSTQVLYSSSYAATTDLALILQSAR